MAVVNRRPCQTDRVFRQVDTDASSEASVSNDDLAMTSASTSGLLATTWLLVMMSPEVVARLTLFMNETETSRLLGLCRATYLPIFYSAEFSLLC